MKEMKNVLPFEIATFLVYSHAADTLKTTPLPTMLRSLDETLLILAAWRSSLAEQGVQNAC